ncbi:hypothetical protein WJX73_010127 [Symbiochloris irregularis]|uniref:Methyltransferase domain-containing protein n=1 Tax=Symbiochloris irregularis TaxID=706552 RepID=A0AAW1P6W9_9CHLO
MPVYSTLPHTCQGTKPSATPAPARLASHASRHRRALDRRCQPCAAQTQTAALPSDPTQALPPAEAFKLKVVEALFRIQPIFQLAANNARKKVFKRAESIGVDMNGQIEALKAIPWNDRLQQVTDPAVQPPSYYTQPFHAYPQGNLCWDAAQQVEAASQAVHANVFDHEGKKLDARGDARLRASYSEHMLQMIPETAGEMRRIVDLGCGTGLSALELLRVFPEAQVTGVDLSPHFLAVGQHLHGTVQSATRAILAEAFRLLRPNGILAMMEMDPSSPSWQRVFKNPIALAAFKSTEPWLLEYVSLDLPQALQQAGFSVQGTSRSTPRHKTVVAQKPA